MNKDLNKEIKKYKEMINKLEEEKMEMANQIELLNVELSHKSSILNQTNKELTDLQGQYKQVLEKLVDLTQKQIEMSKISEEDKFYRDQLTEQALCIKALQDKLWKSEYQNCVFKLNTNNLSKFETPTQSLEKAKVKIFRLKQKLGRLRIKSKILQNENDIWIDFANEIYRFLISSKRSNHKIQNDSSKDIRTSIFDLLHKQGNNKADQINLKNKKCQITENHTKEEEKHFVSNHNPNNDNIEIKRKTIKRKTIGTDENKISNVNLINQKKQNFSQKRLPSNQTKEHLKELKAVTKNIKQDYKDYTKIIKNLST